MGKWLAEHSVWDRGNVFWGLGILGATIIAVEALRLLLRKAKKKITESSATEGGAVAAAGWSLLVEEAAPPLILFLWIWGTSAIAAIVFRTLVDQPEAAEFLAGLRWAARVANAATFFWLLFRLIGSVEALIRQWAARTGQKWDDVIAAVVARGLRLVAPLLGIIIILPMLEVPEKYHQFLREGTSVLVTAAVGFILYEIVSTGEAAVIEQFRIDAENNLAQRKIQTQVKMLKRIAVALIGLFTLASVLMVFEPVRHLATSLLASAGVAGVVLGFAAQKSLATLVAGVQIAFTQPIRLDDVVIVEGEWGRIEEITMTYVVVLIWDLRRMVLPITYFIEKPFQNWTRVNADLLGTVFLYVDYTVPVGAVREELERILAASKLWDQKVKGVQVTDSKEKTLELRILVSASNASRLWDLRCEVREKLVDFLQRNHGQALPRLRLESPLTIAAENQGKPN